MLRVILLCAFVLMLPHQEVWAQKRCYEAERFSVDCACPQGTRSLMCTRFRDDTPSRAVCRETCETCTCPNTTKFDPAIRPFPDPPKPPFAFPDPTPPKPAPQPRPSPPPPPPKPVAGDPSFPRVLFCPQPYQSCVGAFGAQCVNYTGGETCHQGTVCKANESLCTGPGYRFCKTYEGPATCPP